MERSVVIKIRIIKLDSDSVGSVVVLSSALNLTGQLQAMDYHFVHHTQMLVVVEKMKGYMKLLQTATVIFFLFYTKNGQ